MNNSIEYAIKQLYRAENRDNGVAVISNYNNQLLRFIEHNPIYANPAEHAMGEAERWMRSEVEPVHRSVHGYPGRDQDM